MTVKVGEVYTRVSDTGVEFLTCTDIEVLLPKNEIISYSFVKLKKGRLVPVTIPSNECTNDFGFYTKEGLMLSTDFPNNVKYIAGRNYYFDTEINLVLDIDIKHKEKFNKLRSRIKATVLKNRELKIIGLESISW